MEGSYLMKVVEESVPDYLLLSEGKRSNYIRNNYDDILEKISKYPIILKKETERRTTLLKTRDDFLKDFHY